MRAICLPLEIRCPPDLPAFWCREVRAWTVYKGALAPQAAGVIHSDFEKNFIKASGTA